ncbi:MAG: F0F1 ATP synthase subunit epsilon [Stagnimonas sp.]|nr:F0F1 ATP synthase subunit epsilon [Stagnimonas sp.]
MSTFQVEVVSAEGQIFSGEATAVYAAAITGEIGILPRHAPLLTKLKAGAVRVQTAAGEQAIFVGGGIMEVQPSLVTILADSAMRAGDADEKAALAAKQRAEEMLASGGKEMDLAKAQAELVEAAARLKFVQDLNKTR